MRVDNFSRNATGRDSRNRDMTEAVKAAKQIA